MPQLGPPTLRYLARYDEDCFGEDIFDKINIKWVDYFLSVLLWNMRSHIY